MRAAILLGVISALGLVAPVSQADAPAAPKASADAPTSTPLIVYHELPTGHVSAIPAVKSRPAAIAPQAKVDAVFTRKNEGGTILFASKAMATSRMGFAIDPAKSNGA